MVRLINDEILSDFDFSYFDICVDCIKGKMTTKIMNDKADKMHRYASLSLHPFVFSFPADVTCILFPCQLSLIRSHSLFSFFFFSFFFFFV